MITKELLIEIGTEELPPKALKRLAMAFADEIQAGLDDQSLSFGEINWYATPRRLAVIVQDLATSQEDREITRRGPALTAAYDQDGNPTKAAEGFARSCHVSVEKLERLETEKGTWLIFKSIEKGKTTAGLIPEVINKALNKLPIPKRMRWGNRDAEFVRPVHWSIVLLGNEVVPCSIMDTVADNVTYGHRFHHPKPIRLRSTKDYLSKLEEKGHVIADFEKRKTLIKTLVNRSAGRLKGNAVIEPDLLDEVTSLVEWPVAISGSFDKQFLNLPREVLTSSMQSHQRYFPVQKKDSHELLNYFITVANIESKDNNEIKTGNEKVIRPRLTDAEFFWKRDSSRPLSHFGVHLKDVVFQKKIGTLGDKTERVQQLAVYMAPLLNVKKRDAGRAAELAKCDLFTEMVGEFPELQGVMGRYYAIQSGEDKEIAQALDEQYMPRFAGDNVPATNAGQLLAIADKVDTIVGIFGIGQAPTGDRDPFG
ncbi:MAG: glycine--tRNA ligase subunit beta, partial [Gammaproteobacteria bacterium]|nr:glycine--tRNA ligase subunit beta [Gammaproteobacteria bacterium]